MNKLISTGLFILVVCQAHPAFGGDPLEALKNPIDRSLMLLNDPQFREPGRKAEQREKLWDIIMEIFDFTEISKRTLARNWRLFSPEERESFTEIFSKLLVRTYIDRIQGAYSNQKIDYLSQHRSKKQRAMVKTQIIGESVTIPIDYRLHEKNGQWKVYDVSVEGISLVKNYRTQFNKLLFKDTPAQLIRRLHEKVAKLEQKQKQKASWDALFRTVAVANLAAGELRNREIRGFWN